MEYKVGFLIIMYLLTVYLIQIQTMSTGSTQKDEWGQGNGEHGNTNKGKWMQTGGMKANKGGWKAGKQWWEWNWHMAALAAATQQLQQQHCPAVPTTQKLAHLHFASQNWVPAAQFLVFWPQSLTPLCITESHPSASSNPMYPTSIWSPLPKNQPTHLSLANIEPPQLGFIFLPTTPPCTSLNHIPLCENWAPPLFFSQFFFNKYDYKQCI